MKKISVQVALFFAAITLLNSCQNEFQQKWNEYDWHGNSDNNHGHLKQTKNYSSEVVFKWMDMQLRLMRTNPTPIGGLPPARYFGYSAIALYESVVPGMPEYHSLSGQLTDMPAMPPTLKGTAYYWPECGNATLASMTRRFFTSATEANKAAIDSLEMALSEAYQLDVDSAGFHRSHDFGQAIAQAVFTWSTTDGASNANADYVPPEGPGLWTRTPPGFAPAALPYWGNNRLMVSTSLRGTDPLAPPTYSSDSGSAYYKMVKEVYDVSQKLTPEQTAIAVYYRDNPGYGGGHYLAILKGILEQENPKLDFSAYVFAKVSIGIVDAGIGCWQTKYQYNQQRPITFIRDVLGHTSWNAVFNTPNFPDFPSGHCTIAGVFAEIMKGFFGSNYHFTDHSYDYLGMPPRSFNSFDAFIKEVSDARVYAGIHNRISCDRGALQGKLIAKNINNTLRCRN
jgi:hypothetical protein